MLMLNLMPALSKRSVTNETKCSSIENKKTFPSFTCKKDFLQQFAVFFFLHLKKKYSN